MNNEWHENLRRVHVLFFTAFVVMMLNFTHSDWLRTQNVNKRAEWLTLFTLVAISDCHVPNLDVT